MGKSCVEVIDQFLTDQLAKGKSELTVKTYGRELEKFSEWLKESGGDITTLTRYDVQSYIKYLEGSSKSATTINKVFASISVFAKFTNNPPAVENIRMPEYRKTRNIAPKSLERKDRNKLLRDIERSGSLRNIALAYTLLLTGLRVSELVALTLLI